MVAQVTPNAIAGNDPQPDATWPLERLAAYAAVNLQTSESIDRHMFALGRKSVLSFFRAGCALSHARTKLLQEGEWVGWQQQNGLARTTVFEAITLFERAKTEDAVEGMTLGQAKKFFGISGCTKGKTAEDNARLSAAKAKKPRNPFKRSSTAPDIASMIVLILAQLDMTIDVLGTASTVTNRASTLGAEVESKANRLVQALRVREVCLEKTPGDVRAATAGHTHFHAAESQL